MPEVLTFKIEDFEGPLDLLLYLVGKNKMNLYDINIMELIDQYTATIRNLQDNRMEVTSEFIDMAAHLVQMKSALLLPRSPEAERMKAELTGRLIEYSACKEVAAKLGSRARDLYTAVPAAWPQAESSSAADKSIGIVFFISHHSTFFSASSIGTRMMRRYSSTATTA